MKSAAVTMVWNDNWFLSRWLAYFGPRLGRENLFVITHGPDPVAAEIANGCNVIAVPRDEITVDFDIIRWKFLSAFTSSLTHFYHSVLCLDVDELVMPTTPDKSLAQVLQGLPATTSWAVPGFELFPTKPGTERYENGQPIGPQSEFGLFSPFYSKSCLASSPVEFSPGAHGLIGEKPALTDQLTLMHLRFVNGAELERRRLEREQLTDSAYNSAGVTVEDMTSSGRLVSWAHAKRRHKKLFNEFDQAPKIEWAAGMSQAASVLPSLAVVRDGHHLFRTQKHDPFAVRLPKWMADLF